MDKPFPGMDPYLEASDLWRGFHHDLASEIRAQLAPYLRPRYYADIESYTPYEDDDEIRIMIPDVSVARAPGDLPAPSPAGVAIAPAPIERSLFDELPYKTYAVNVYDARDNRLVTAIELLSPANKRASHPAHAAYLEKRRRLLAADIHLLEVDLLRRGERLPYDEPPPEATYYISLCRANRRPVAEIWPLQLSEPIPLLPVPLLPPDADVPLDVGAAIATIYERGAYDLRLDYGEPPPPPPLADAEARWLSAQLRQHGLR